MCLVLTLFCALIIQDIKKKDGPAGVAASLPKVKAEAERLDLMDMAAGIMAELLYTDKLLSQIEEYRPIMLHVSTRTIPVISTLY